MEHGCRVAARQGWVGCRDGWQCGDIAKASCCRLKTAVSQSSFLSLCLCCLRRLCLLRSLPDESLPESLLLELLLPESLPLLLLLLPASAAWRGRVGQNTGVVGGSRVLLAAGELGTHI